MNQVSSKTPLLQLSAIHKSFPGVKALTNASLSVYAGEVMALVGENGAGKSTLMKILSGIYQRDSGSINYLGKSVTYNNPKASQEAGISIIHQELNLIDDLSIAENIFLGREFTTKMGNIDWKKMYSEADILLERLSCTYNSRTLVRFLSIGEKQMIEIAKALSFDAKVIIMDEPTDALTKKETLALFSVIKELKENNCGIVYISHRLPEIFAVCNRVTVLRDGEFIDEKNVSDIDENQLIELMVGRALTEQFPYLSVPKGSPVLEIQDIVGDDVNGASFKLHAGEVLGFSGLMGSGRTELMKIIYGALRIKSGAIILDGSKIVNRSPQDSIENGIAYVSEDRKLDGLVLGMTVKENASMSSLKRFTRMGVIGTENEREVVDDYISKFNIKTPSRRQLVGLLSGGNQQKVAIAKGLMTEPKVLILDEPTRGVDVGARKEIYELINTLKASGLGIILISSDMPEVMGISDRIITMQAGHITGDFERDEFTQEKLLAASILN